MTDTDRAIAQMTAVVHEARNKRRSGLDPRERADFEDAESEYLAQSGVRRRGGNAYARLDAYQREEDYHAALMRYVRHGKGLSDNERWPADLQALSERRAQSSVAGTAGGFLLSEQLHSRIVEGKAAVGGLASVAFSLTTSDGREYPVPKVDATGETGALLAESEKDSEGTDSGYDLVTLGAYAFTSRIVKVPRDLLADSQYDIEGHLAGRLGARLARAEAPKFVTGSGVQEPQGILTAEGLVVGTTATGTNTVTRAELVGLEASLDDAYLADAVFVLSPSAEQSLKAEEVDDGSGNSTGQAKYPELNEGRLIGRRYVVEQNLPAMTTGNRPILIVSPQAFWVRSAGSAMLTRYEQMYADANQVGYSAIEQVDSGLVDPRAVRALVLS